MNERHARRHRVRRLVMNATAALLVTIIGTLQGGGPLQSVAVAVQTSADTYRNVYNGWKSWHVYCYRCHGVNGLGATTAPSLIDPNRKLGTAEFLKIVRNGIPDKGMQAWDKLLDDKQIAQVQLYVRARTEGVLPPGRPDEIGPNGGQWVPPAGWPAR